MDRCPLDPVGGCIFYGMDCLYCQKQKLGLAVQLLRWTIPVIGPLFKTWENQVECARRMYNDK